MLLTFIVTIFLPKSYRSTATILPISTERQSLSSILGGASGGKPSTTIRIFLESKALAERMLGKYDLYEKLGRRRAFWADNDPAVIKERAINKFISNVINVEIGMDGTVDMSVEVGDPELALSIAGDSIDYAAKMLNDNSVPITFIPVDDPTMPSKPYKPNMLFNLLFAFVFSLSAGVGLVFLESYFKG